MPVQVLPRPIGFRPAVAVLVLAALLVSALAAPATTRATGGSEFIRLTNQYRAGVALGPVALHAAVDQVAVERTAQMADSGTFAHDMDYVRARLEQLGVCWTNMGEIIAWESGWPTHSYERTMQQWWNSTGHHAIIVGDFTHAGGSWAVGGDGRTYSTMVFVKLCSSTATTTASIGRVVFAAGSHTGYRFQDGVAVSSKTATLASRSGANAAERRRIGGRIHLLITNGIWAGYWVPETYRSYLPGIYDLVVHASPVRLTFGAGTHTGYRYDSTGTILGRRSYTLWRQSGADASKTAVINGRRHFYAINGVWAGYWVPDTANVWTAR